MVSHMTTILICACALSILFHCDVTSATNNDAHIADKDFENAVVKALQVAKEELQEVRRMDEQLYRSGVDADNDLGHRGMHGLRRSMRKTSISDAEHAFVNIRATQELTNIFGRSVDELKQQRSLLDVWSKNKSPSWSPRHPVCRKGPYRTIDGSCNNLQFTTWGMAGRPQKRYLASAYQDDVSAPRILSVMGQPLPSPRLISNVIHRCGTCDIVEPRDSVFVMQWGQLLDHDFLDTSMTKGFDGSDITCCNLGPNFLGKRRACFPIEIPMTDTHFNTSCMNFVRSAPAMDDNCNFGRRNQMNQLSSYLDASYIYGVDEEDMQNMRENAGGYLKMTAEGLFPPRVDQDTCIHNGTRDYCMKSGDRRLHVVPTLAASQILMLREHNRIAHILGEINPHWDDELIFQETRKIVIAINQHITYMEYLPVILGPAHMSKYGLYSKRRGYNTVYNPSVDATVANVFGAVAFRFGHSQVPGNVDLLYRDGNRESFSIEQTYNRPATLFMDSGKGCDHVCRWMANDRSGKSDQFLEPGLRVFLFLNEKGESFDLAALNIQRGRDHGIPGYNAWRKWCGLAPAFHFAVTDGGLVDMEPDTAHLLSTVYRHPDDIDLYPGALAERHVLGGAVGRTLACIIARQFMELKTGDRFFYENKLPKTGFTKLQLNSIKRVRLSKILCNNIETTESSRDAFKIPSQQNPSVACNLLPDIDLNLWRDSHGKPSHGKPSHASHGKPSHGKPSHGKPSDGNKSS